jgi:hypothetical protein
LQFAAVVTGKSTHLSWWSQVITGFVTIVLAGFILTIFGRNLRLGFMRARQSEAKANLKAAYTALKAWFQEKDRYPASLSEAGFAPYPTAQYVYFSQPEEHVGGQHAAALREKLRNEALAVLSASGHDGPVLASTHFRVLAVGRLGGALDIWSISDSDSTPRNLVPAVPPSDEAKKQGKDLAELARRALELERLLNEANARLREAGLPPVGHEPAPAVPRATPRT